MDVFLPVAGSSINVVVLVGLGALVGFFVAVGAGTSFLFLVKIGLLSIWLLASAGFACVSGLWMILIGIFKVLAPKSEHGDASDND